MFKPPSVQEPRYHPPLGADVEGTEVTLEDGAGLRHVMLLMCSQLPVPTTNKRTLFTSQAAVSLDTLDNLRKRADVVELAC